MEKKKILFVDDEPNILSGIRRMLHSMRNDFDLQFAKNGRDAMELMKQGGVDVVVSDMRMRGMDGAQLLTEIQQRFPHAVTYRLGKRQPLRDCQLRDEFQHHARTIEVLSVPVISQTLSVDGKSLARISHETNWEIKNGPV